MDGKGQQYAPRPQGQGNASGAGAAGANLRMPTVREALPYSPFSTIVPFSPDIIPPPTALPSTPSSAFQQSNDVKAAQHTLEQLSAGATNAAKASDRCQRTIRDVQRLLHADSLTQFKFKKIDRSQPYSSAVNNTQTSAPALSSFAKMVYDNTDVGYRYITPTSPEPQEKAGKKQEWALKHEAAVNGYHTSPHGDAALSASQQRHLQAVVPSSTTQAQRAEYQLMSDSALSNAAAFKANQVISSDQRQKGDAAVQNFRALISDIFEAEDQLQPDTSDKASLSNNLFVLRDTEDGSMALLKAEMQTRLDAHVYKVVSTGRLLDIDVEQINRLQKICQVPVASVEALSLFVGDDWSEQDVEEWIARISAAEQGLVAARTLLRTMIGGAQRKELQSEDFLRETLDALKAVIEGCVVPIVEESVPAGEKKGTASANSKFATAASRSKELIALLHAATKSMRLLGELLVKTKLDESSISSVEYLCKTLVFAENANTDAHSALGVQNFETMRRCAMDVMAKIFTKYTDQRQFIFDEILISLEKLPAKKQSARQYRLTDSKPIQLVSALLMRLIQTSATRSQETLNLHTKTQVNEDGEEASEEESDEGVSDEEGNIKISPAKPRGKSDDLRSIVQPLREDAQANASYVAKILIQRALATSKSSDEPYRKLLDIFTEDFLNVLGSPDWPAAELLLRTLVMHMIGIIDNPKSPSPSRTFALELLGTMGSGILELQMAARQATKSVDTTESATAFKLCGYIKQLETSNLESGEAVAFNGPYRLLMEYLEARSANGDPQLQTARGYHLSEWAFLVTGGREGSTGSDASADSHATRDLQAKLKGMFDDSHSLEGHGNVGQISKDEACLAAMVVTLNSKFCKAFSRIFSVLLSSMTSEQSTVKSRSLKSVVMLLEKDPGILDRTANVLNHILRCADDASPLVRDSALGLIAKCIAMRPALDVKVYSRVVLRSKDAAAGVRKRAMKLLKEIYLRNNATDIRSAIADAIITRIEDSDENVNEIARTTMEEIWFFPFYKLHLESERAVEARLAYGSQAALLVATVEQGQRVLKVLEALLRRLLHSSKAAETNAHVCKTLVTVLFDGIVDNSDIPGAPAQSSILKSLTIFARASPDLFTAAQLERLEPYTKNLNRSDDLEVYRSVITILRYVVPHQALMKKDFLSKMHMTLLTSITKLRKEELTEVAPCLWTISCLINDTKRLATTMTSVLQNVHAMQNLNLAADERNEQKAAKLMTIAGEFGNACNFGDHLDLMRGVFGWYKGRSAEGLMVEILCPFTSPKQPESVRLAALEAVCTVCQAWPSQFLRADVTNAFETVFRDPVRSLETALVAGLEGFFAAQEAPEDKGDVPELGSGVASGTERLGRTYVASDQDGASTSMAQRFLKPILRLALSSCDEPAFIAAKLVVSINKQGLVHPKESGPALVALETCPNKSIANEAFQEHKSQHQKHESLFEKEYMRAVQQTFEYQRQIIGDAKGFSGQPPTSKMHLTWEVLKGGKAQVRKKFLTNISQKLNFDPASLDASARVPQQLLFVRFCVENLAFFDYDKVDELLHLLSCLEKVFDDTGTAVAQSIESEVLQLHVNGTSDIMTSGNMTSDNMTLDNIVVSGTLEPSAPGPPQVDIDPARLRQLAVSAQLLTLTWETRSFLRRVWNMQKHVAKPKQSAKDAVKACNRATNAPALTEAYLRRVNEVFSSADTPEQQRAICSSFVELASVDTEVKVGSEEDVEAMEVANGYETPSESMSAKSNSVPPSGGARGKKRKSVGGNGGTTPRKKGRPSVGGRKKSGSKALDEDEGEMWD